MKITRIISALIGILALGGVVAASAAETANSTTTAPAAAVAKPNSETRQVAAFNAIDIAGAYTVTVTDGQALSLSVAGDKATVSQLLTEVKNNVLYIHYPNDFKPAPNQPITITITTPKLRALSTFGSSTVTLNQLLGQQFQLIANGRQQIVLTGQVDDVNLQLTGNTDLDAEKLTAQKVLLQGMGKAQVKLSASNELHVHTTGDIHIKLFGNPKVVTTSMFGGGQLQVSN